MTDRLSGSTPSLADVIEEAIESHSLRLHTALPGVIKEWDPATQTASVKPAVQQSVRNLKGEHIFEDLPLIYDVPVMFARTLGGGVTCPVAVGDTGLLVFPELDPGQWRYSDPSAAPRSAGDQRRHDISGAVLLLGLYQNAHKVADFDNENVVVTANGSANVLLGGPTASDFVALSSKVDQALLMISRLLAGLQVNMPGVTPTTPIPGGIWTPTGTLADAVALKTAALAIASYIPDTSATKVKAL